MEFERIKKIYDALGDEQSRRIFMKRLSYSLSGDMSYIHDMVFQEMKAYGNDDVMVSLLRWLSEKQGNLVVFGGGFAGEEVLDFLLWKGYQVKCLVDNNSKLWGQVRHGIALTNPAEIQKFESPLVIIATNSYVDEIRNQLSEMGVTVDNVFVPSKEWWLGAYDQYFDPIIGKPVSEEVWIDAGAYDGTDTDRFIEWCSGNYSEAHVFEPSDKHISKVRDKLQNFKNIHLYQKGLWDKEENLCFCISNNADSYVTNEGNDIIQTVAIDDISFSSSPTFIKMDIEGSELNALIGAKGIIEKCRPKLAICVYHKPEDIIEIPLWILDRVPSYRLYLRHYSYVYTETVLYAI